MAARQQLPDAPGPATFVLGQDGLIRARFIERDLDLNGLRTCWQNQFGRPAPEHLTRYLLFRIIAYKVQADRLGDLDAETLKVLELVARRQGRPSAVSKELAELNQRRVVPAAGTVLVREWDRKCHRVMVMAEGFAWNGRTFQLLRHSKAKARRIKHRPGKASPHRYTSDPVQTAPGVPARACLRLRCRGATAAPARVHVNMLHRDLLLPFASMPV